MCSLFGVVFTWQPYATMADKPTGAKTAMTSPATGNREDEPHDRQPPLAASVPGHVNQP